MRDSKSKSDLKTALKVDTSVRLQPKPNDVNINGCAQLWSTSCPNDGTVKNLADTLLEPHRKVGKHTILTEVRGDIFRRYSSSC